MSNQNENIQPYQSRDLVNIDETGKVVINSTELAKMTEELSLEELEAVSGGAVDVNIPCNTTNSSQCGGNNVAGCGVKLFEQAIE